MQKKKVEMVTLKTSKLRRNVYTEAIQIKYGRMSFGNKYESVCTFCVPEFLLAFHFGNLVSDGLFEVIVTRNFTCDNRELLPVISHQYREHSSHLMFQAWGQLQLQSRLGLFKYLLK